MRSFLFVAIATLALLVPQVPRASERQTLDQAVWNMLNPDTFDLTSLDDQCTVMVEVGTNRQFFTKQDIAAYLATAKAAGTKFQASNFKVLNKNETGKFGSITYQVVWKSSTGNSTTTVRLTSKEVWERQASGWVRLFAAMDQ